MNKKIIGIFIFLLMICLLFTPFVSADIISNKKNLDNDIPIWELGDKWFYNIDDLNIYFSDDKSFFKLKAAGLILEVTDVTSDTYVVDFELRLSGNTKIILPTSFGGGEIDLKFGGLLPILISGKIEYNKIDMGIKNIDSQISGVCKLKIKNIDFIPIPFLSIPIRFNINLHPEFSTPFKLINFPVEVEKKWGINSTDLTINGYIKNPWFRLMNIVHNIIRIFGLIPDQFMLYSDIIADILPVVDIKNTLSIFNISNVFSIYEINETIFNCVNYEQISVQGNALNCYNISVARLVNIYYSPEISNIARVFMDTSYISDLFSSIMQYFQLDFNVSDMSDINIEFVKTN